MNAMIDMYDLLKRLFPICRSVTGNGVRKTFDILRETIPLRVIEAPSDEQCFDWTVPPEWNLRSAWIKDPDGNVIIDFAENNLHVLSYCAPVSGDFTLEELRPHLHSDPDMPNAIPYKTSYYHRDWGFCLTHDQLTQLKPGTYQVEVDATIEPGSMTMADAVLPGETNNEFFLSCYTCHPSMANDSLSGVVMAARLYQYLAEKPNRHFTYRFIFVPETIGAIAYLARNKELFLNKAIGGMVLTCLGAEGTFHYKKTRRGDHWLDRIATDALANSDYEHEIRDFVPRGSDERQYSSPGFNLPVGSLMRPAYGCPEYHTSLDNLDFVTARGLGETFAIFTKIIDAVDEVELYKNLNPFCEPFLSKYDLYHSVGGPKTIVPTTTNILNLLNYCDGDHDLVAIANITGATVEDLKPVAERLREKGLLELM